MSDLHTHKKEIFSINMLRDQCVMVKRGGDDPEVMKKAFSKVRRIMKTLPPCNVDTVAEVRKHRRKPSA